MSALERCCDCDAPTGRAGIHEDSLYAGHRGPYCEDCWAELPDVLASEADALRAENRKLALEVLTAMTEAMELHEENKRLRSRVAAADALAEVVEPHIAYMMNVSHNDELRAALAAYRKTQEIKS